jgi:hypothetical protein
MPFALDGRPRKSEIYAESGVWLGRCPQCRYCLFDLARPQAIGLEVVTGPDHQPYPVDPFLPPQSTSFASAARWASEHRRWAIAGHLYLAAAWICDDLASESTASECARLFRVQAVAQYARAWKAGLVVVPGPAASYWLLIAELLRRAEFWDEAASFASRGLLGGAEGDLAESLLFELFLISEQDSAAHALEEVPSWVRSHDTERAALRAFVNTLAVDVPSPPLAPKILERRVRELFGPGLRSEMTATEVLSQRLPPEQIEALFSKASERDCEKSFSLRRVLSVVHGANPVLISWLSSPNNAQRTMAIETLGKRRCVEAVSQLWQISQNVKAPTRERNLALAALEAIGDPSIMPLLPTMLASEEPRTRSKAYQIAARVEGLDALVNHLPVRNLGSST